MSLQAAQAISLTPCTIWPQDLHSVHKLVYQIYIDCFILHCLSLSRGSHIVSKKSDFCVTRDLIHQPSESTYQTAIYLCDYRTFSNKHSHTLLGV